jgi:glutathione gamma-glutamylcysteinyltransferase
MQGWELEKYSKVLCWRFAKSFEGRESDNVQTLLSRLIESLTADAEALITWVVEVRRKEEGGPSLSKEEKERLFSKVAFPDFHFIL